jgi:hypothetical protein
MRAGDQDREVAVQVLGTAYAEGRLTREEYDERARATTAARTLGDLRPLLADLVPAERAPAATDPIAKTPAELRDLAREAYEAKLRRALVGMLLPSLVCLLVWVVGGLGPQGWEPAFPWPLFVVIGTGIRPLRVRLERQETVRRELARLEKKQRKALDVAPRKRS